MVVAIGAVNPKAQAAELGLAAVLLGSIVPPTSIPEKALEPGRRQLGVAHRMLDRFVPEIGLDRPGIDALIGQLKTAGVPQHVRVKLHIESGSLASTLDHRLEAPPRER